jgi:hypothetical protein
MHKILLIDHDRKVKTINDWKLSFLLHSSVRCHDPQVKHIQHNTLSMKGVFGTLDINGTQHIRHSV